LNNEAERRIGYFYIIGYNYDFDYLKELLNKFDNSLPVLEDDIQDMIKGSMLKFGDSKDTLSMFQQNFSVHF
jgi:hypothetical protein